METDNYGFSFNYDSNVLLCRCKKINSNTECLTKFFNTLAKNGIALGLILKNFSFDDENTTEIFFVTSDDNYNNLKKLLDEFSKNNFIESFNIIKDVVLLSFEAPDMKKFPGVVADLSELFENAGFNPIVINSSEIKIMYVFRKEILNSLNELESKLKQKWSQ